MSSKDQNSSEFNLEDCPSGKGFKINIAVASWNASITSKLFEGAIQTLTELGLDAADIKTMRVPGTFELPYAAQCLIKNHPCDAVICLGCVIQGDTKHDDYINHAVANGLTQLSILSDKPVIFGVVTVNNLRQAMARSGGKYGNKGIEAAVTAVKMIDATHKMSEGKSPIGF